MIRPIDRILYGSDAAVGANLRPREGWAAFRRLPLTEREFERNEATEQKARRRKRQA